MPNGTFFEGDKKKDDKEELQRKPERSPFVTAGAPLAQPAKEAKGASLGDGPKSPHHLYLEQERSRDPKGRVPEFVDPTSLARAQFGGGPGLVPSGAGATVGGRHPVYAGSASLSQPVRIWAERRGLRAARAIEAAPSGGIYGPFDWTRAAQESALSYDAGNLDKSAASFVATAGRAARAARARGGTSAGVQLANLAKAGGNLRSASIARQSRERMRMDSQTKSRSSSRRGSTRKALSNSWDALFSPPNS